MDFRIADPFTDVSFGAGGRSRTLDLRITNALLYQLSYTGILEIAELQRAANEKLYQHDALLRRHGDSAPRSDTLIPKLSCPRPAFFSDFTP